FSRSYARARPELLLASDNNFLTGFEARFDECHIAVDLADSDGPHLDPVLGIHHVGKSAARITLDGRARHDSAVLDDTEPYADVHKLPWPQLAISVGEGSFESDRAGLRIDAIIENRKDALLQQSLPVCIERRHRDLSFGERLIHRRKMLLRERKGDGDRFQLRDDDYSARFPGANEITCID